MKLFSIRLILTILGVIIVPITTTIIACYIVIKYLVTGKIDTDCCLWPVNIAEKYVKKIFGVELIGDIYKS